MKKGFTLIELLIVVAIIAILAAIAVPNFLEAQMRSKVSRMKADMRTAATGIEAYAVDYNKYPYDGFYVAATRPPNPTAYGSNYWYLSKMLTTPQAYLTTVIFKDPFRIGAAGNVPVPYPGNWQADNIRYIMVESTWGDDWDAWVGNPVAVSTYFGAMSHEWGAWRVQAAGPDKNYGPNGWPGVSSVAPYSYPVGSLPMPYDPTNGTVSAGDIIRSQKSPNGYINGAT